MKKIDYKELREELIQVYGKEKNKDFKIRKIIRQIRHFNPELKIAFYEYFIEHKEPTLNIEGVTFNELVEDEKMEALRAFLMLDWLSKNPIEAMEYMASERFRSPMEFSAMDLDRIKAKLEQQGYKDPSELEDETSDIEVEIKAEADEQKQVD